MDTIAMDTKAHYNTRAVRMFFTVNSLNPNRRNFTQHPSSSGRCLYPFFSHLGTVYLGKYMQDFLVIHPKSSEMAYLWASIYKKFSEERAQGWHGWASAQVRLQLTQSKITTCTKRCTLFPGSVFDPLVLPFPSQFLYSVWRMLCSLM